MAGVPLSVQESLEYAQQTAYWDGVAAGVQIAAQHAKDMITQKILQSRKPDPPPAQPESKEVMNDTESRSEQA